MDFDYGEYYRRGHVPAFGSWDWNDAVPFTQCFESARQPPLVAYGCSVGQDRDLYVAGDLYENHIVTPAMIVVPRRRAKVGQEAHVKVGIKEKRRRAREADAPPPSCPTPAVKPRPTPKPVDEDLYKISPELLSAKPRKKRGLGCFSSCFLPKGVL